MVVPQKLRGTRTYSLNLKKTTPQTMAVLFSYENQRVKNVAVLVKSLYDVHFLKTPHHLLADFRANKNP
jgi:hypothetical protein